MDDLTTFIPARKKIYIYKLNFSGSWEDFVCSVFPFGAVYIRKFASKASGFSLSVDFLLYFPHHTIHTYPKKKKLQ